jgi:hypothetical protein
MNMNKILLFPSTIDEERFYNVLAYRKIKNNSKQIDILKEELVTLLNNCEIILTKYGSNSGLVQEIIDFNDKIALSPESNDELLSRRDDLLTELNDLISELKNDPETLSIGEDLERDSNFAFNRQKMMKDLNDKNDQITSEYPDYKQTESLDLKEYYPFKDIYEMTTPVNFLSSKEEIGEDTIPESTVNDEEIMDESLENRAKVVRISEAPVALLEKVNKKEEVKEEETPLVEADNSFFNESDELTKSIMDASEEKDIIPPAHEEEVTSIDSSANLSDDILTTSDDLAKETLIKEESASDSSKPILDEAIMTPIEEAPKEEIKESEPIIADTTSLVSDPVKDEKEEPKEETNSTSMSYLMEDGITLADIAEAAYYDRKYWEYLYKINKDLIDSKLKENNVEYNDSIKDNKDILNGITITVPYSLPDELANDKEQAYQLVA